MKTINIPKRYEITKTSQYQNRSNLLRYGKKVAVIEHYLNDEKDINILENWIETACNNYGKLQEMNNELIGILSQIIGSMALERVERFDLNNKAKELLKQIEES